jgi:hypothetical protein
LAYATVDDVEARYGQPLVGPERVQAPIWLNSIERRLRRRIKNFDDMVSLDPDGYREDVIDVECQAVIRILKNPEGYRSESEGTYSYSLDSRVASGFMLILDSEWEMLDFNRGAFTINPTPPGWRRGWYSWREGADWSNPDIGVNGW